MSCDMWHLGVWVLGQRMGVQRKFRRQTSDNMERWKAKMGRVRERRVRRKKIQVRKMLFMSHWGFLDFLIVIWYIDGWFIYIYTCIEHTRVYKYTILCNQVLKNEALKLGPPVVFNNTPNLVMCFSERPMNLAHVRNPSGSGHKTRNRTVKEEMRRGYDRWRRLAAPGCSSPVDLELGIFFLPQRRSHYRMISPYFTPSARVLTLKATQHSQPWFLL